MAGRRCTVCLGFFFPCAFLFGALLIAFGVVLYVEYPSVLIGEVEKRVTVEKGHATYEQLQKPSINIYKAFYFFNFTNVKEFEASKGEVTPILVEVGPYSYLENRTKKLCETSNNDQLNYTQRKTFFYDQATSSSDVSDSDIVCTINIPLVAAINATKDNLATRTILRGFMDVEKVKIYVCHNATALAWGYTDTLIKFLHKFHMYPLEHVSIQVNDSIYDQNISSINTGESNISMVGQYIQWNGLRKLTIWEKDTDANKIRGTEGFFFRPNLKEGDHLAAFVDDVMRSIDLVYEGRVEHLGLRAHRYGIDNSTFKSAFSEPRNAQFFNWCPDGMFYLGVTQVKETPVYGSKPHFLDGDPLLLESVKGLNPVREKHDTVIDVEPITGANVFFKRQLQINIQVNRSTKHFLANMHETQKIQGYNKSGVLYLPVLYINENSEIDEAFKKYLMDKGLSLVDMVKVAVPIIFGMLIFAGVLSILVGLLVCFCWLPRMKKHNGELTPLLDKD